MTPSANETEALTVDEAERIVFAKTNHDSGRFYGRLHQGLALGMGLIYDSLIFPVYDDAKRQFRAFRGAAIVLTHECDLDRENDKLYNDDVLLAPFAEFEDLFDTLKSRRSDVEARAFLGDLANGNISQLMYLPPWPEKWPRGIILYFNRISHSHYAEFERANAIGTLTTYGLLRLQERVSHHLLREKQDQLPPP